MAIPYAARVQAAGMVSTGFHGPDRSDPQLIAFLRRYVPEDLAPVLEQVQHIQFFDYDWALNDQTLQKAGAGRNGASER